MKKKAFAKWALRAVGLVLLIIVLRQMDFGKLKSALVHFDYSMLVVFVLGIFLLFLGRCYRYFFLLRAQDITLPLKTTFLIYLKSTYWSMVVPGRLGELSRIGYLMKRGIPADKSIANLAIERIVDTAVHFLFCLAAVAFVALDPTLSKLILIGAALCLFFVLSFSVVFKLSGVRRLLERIRLFDSNALEVVQAFTKFKRKWLFFAMSVALWSGYAVLFTCLAQGLALDVPLLYPFFFTFLAELIAMVPITFAGIGTRDGFLVLMFARLGVEPEKALLFSLCFLLAYLELILISVSSLLLNDKPAES